MGEHSSEPPIAGGSRRPTHGAAGKLAQSVHPYVTCPIRDETRMRGPFVSYGLLMDQVQLPAGTITRFESPRNQAQRYFQGKLLKYAHS
jgi:hypothetical protein